MRGSIVTAAGALAVLAGSASGQVVINEVFENPANGGDLTSEYIELYGPAGMDLTGYALVLVKGGRDTSPADEAPDGVLVPEIDEAFSLDGRSIGTSGFFTLFSASAAGFSRTAASLAVNGAFDPGLPEGPANPRYLDGACFHSLHIPSVDSAGTLDNDRSSTYLLVRRRPNHSLSSSGASVYGTGYVWKKDWSCDVDFNGRLDHGGETAMYVGDGGDGTQTVAGAFEPCQIVDEVAWSNDSGKEYNTPDRGRDTAEITETAGYNPDAVSRLRYRAVNPNAGSVVDPGTGALVTTSIADESWVRGETTNSQPGTPAYLRYKGTIDVGPDATAGTMDDQKTFGSPTNPAGALYVYAGAGSCNPDVAPFWCAPSAGGTVRFDDFPITGFRLTPGGHNDTPAGTALSTTAYALQFRLVRGDFDFDGDADCDDRTLLAGRIGSGLDDTATLTNNRNTATTADDVTYTGYRWRLTEFNATLAMVRMSMTDGATGAWGSGVIVTSSDLAAFDAMAGAPSCAPCPADFDGDGDEGTDADIEAFMAALAGSPCATCLSTDIDGDGDEGTDADIEAFFIIISGGC